MRVRDRKHTERSRNVVMLVVVVGKGRSEFYRRHIITRRLVALHRGISDKVYIVPDGLVNFDLITPYFDLSRLLLPTNCSVTL